MSYQSHNIDFRKKEAWDEEYKRKGYNVYPEFALQYELETFFPSYVFIARDCLDQIDNESYDTTGDYTPRRLTFFMRDDKPMVNTFDGDIQWFDIEPMNMSLVCHRIHDLLPTIIYRDEVEGFLVPLQESDTFDSIDNANAYLHNLMFWESILPPNACGPLTQRLCWLTQKIYSMRVEQSDVVKRLRRMGVRGLSITTDSTMEILDEAASLMRETTNSKTAAKTSKSKKTQNGKRKCSHILVPKPTHEQLAKEAMKLAALMRQNEILQNIDVLKRQLVTETERLEEQTKLLSEYYDSIINNIGNSHDTNKSRSDKGRD